MISIRRIRSDLSPIFLITANTFFTDAVYWAPASMVAVNNCFRYLIGAISPLYTPTAVNAIGPGWFYTIWAAVNALGGLTIAWVVKFGTKVRLESEPWKTLEREKEEKEMAEKEAGKRDAQGDEIVVELGQEEIVGASTRVIAGGSTKEV